MNDRISLTVADDHAMVRKGLSAFLATAPDIDVLDIASCGAEAVIGARTHTPDVVLLDLFMPDQPAARTVQQIRAASPGSQIVILTSHEGDDHVLPMTRAGAISYILKDTTPEALVQAVRGAAAGESTISPRIARALVGALGHNAGSGDTRHHGALTEREMEVLRCIAEGLSNMAIGARLTISEKTVKSHVSSILGKLCLTDRTQAAVYAWREGIVRT